MEEEHWFIEEISEEAKREFEELVKRNITLKREQKKENDRFQSDNDKSSNGRMPSL